MKLLLLTSTLLCLAAQTAPSQPAPTDAQTLQEVQAENQKLRDDLAAAQKRIKQLESANGSKTVPAGAPAAPPSDAKADLMGNPIAVLDFFQKKFAEDMTKRRVPLPQEKDSKAARQVYLGKAKEWCEGINRTTYSIEWRGRIVSVGEVKGGNQDFEFQCVSADNKSNFGRLVPASIIKTNAPQLATAMADREAIWIMTATLVPATYVDPEMVQPNTFDNPQLAGPCVAFKFQLKVLRLYPEKGAPAPTPKEN
ncbi:MAG: hypothetical protein K8R92_03855 [Planctomycetes bacterium]|nr:hypothetical protein [Planctomycetota bacterium]